MERKSSHRTASLWARSTTRAICSSASLSSRACGKVFKSRSTNLGHRSTVSLPADQTLDVTFSLKNLNSTALRFSLCSFSAASMAFLIYQTKPRRVSERINTLTGEISPAILTSLSSCSIWAFVLSNSFICFMPPWILSKSSALFLNSCCSSLI